MRENLVEELFEALTFGDEHKLELCLNEVTFDSVLEFEKTYGESPLHLCVKIGGVSHLGVVRCLLANGLFDSTIVDTEGRTVLECAAEEGSDELFEELIKVETQSLDDATACYVVMRHNSLKLFKRFLSAQKWNEAEEFQGITGALIKLNVKHFVLSEELRIFALWKLSDYGYRNLAGNWPGSKDPNEWKDHIGIVLDCWRVINEKYNTRLFGDVDDELLHYLQILHNHIYFLKHKQFLSYLPIQEAVFCVAMFLSIFKNKAQFQEYRLVVNKCLVVEFVRMISQQLEIVKKYLQATEAELITIMGAIETSSASVKEGLIADLMAKLESSNVSNKVILAAQFAEKISAAGKSNKDTLIKEMVDKIKKFDKTWAERKMVEIKKIDTTSKDLMIEHIGGRLRHVSHPQNVANRAIAEWKKGKDVDTIAAEIVSGESFSLHHLLRGKDRRVKRKLMKCYIKMKQLYSLHKITFYCEQILTVGKKDEAILVPSVKRMLQVIGEAVKNTQNSANMPGQAGKALATILTELFPRMNKLLREVFSHNVSLKKILLGDIYETKACKTLLKYMHMTRAAVLLLYAVSVADMRHSFYGLMRQCSSFAKLRSLLLYVGSTDEIDRRQAASFQDAKKYFRESKHAFTELQKEPMGEMPQFKYLQNQWNIKCDIVDQMNKFFEEDDGFSFKDVRRACFSSDDLGSVKKMCDWKLTMSWAKEFYYRVHANWRSSHVESMAIEWVDPRVLKYNPSVIAGILKNTSVAMECCEEYDYLQHTRELIDDLGIAALIGEDDLQHLNQRLKSYYNNMFQLDNKYKILESFCKERKIPQNKATLGQLVKRDQEYLQKLFDDRRGKLRMILKDNGIDHVDELAARMFHLPTHVLSSIEYIQLEICEMLLSIGYFGDSFHYMKHRIPMIQGKNYRNFLAHDSLSYNILTDSSMEKIVINAFVFACTELRLFGGNRRNKLVDLSFPTLDEMRRWVEVQTDLIQAFRAKDVNEMHAAVRAGGEIKSHFYTSPNELHIASDSCQLPELIHPCEVAPKVVECVERYFPGFRDVRSNESYQLMMALRLRDFPAAFDRSIGRGDRVIREELFSWPELMANVRQTDLFVHLVAANNRLRILAKLIEYGNERGVREMLPWFDGFSTTHGRGPLGDAMLYCERKIAELLMHRTSVPHLAVIILAIMLHWDDVFVNMMSKTEIDADVYRTILVTTAQAKNYTAAVFLLEHEAFKRYILAAFQSCAKMAVRVGQEDIFQHLLSKCPIIRMDPSEFVPLIHHAALKKQWRCVQMLLNLDVPVDMMIPHKSGEDKCVLLILVKFGQSRLLTQVKSVNNAIFGTLLIHPLATAVHYGMTSARMVRALRRLGFDWLDRPTVLHEAISRRQASKDTFELIWKLVEEGLAYTDGGGDDKRFALIFDVLQRWKMISFIEESKHGRSSLFCAVENADKPMMEKLLNWARKARTIDGKCILGGIIFERESSYITFGNSGNSSKHHLWDIHEACGDMVTRIKTSKNLEGLKSQEFTIDATIPVTFTVLTTCNESIVHSSKLALVLSDPTSLLKSLKDLLAFVNATPLNQSSVVLAKYSMEGTVKYFLQVEEISCIFDVHPPDRVVDLADTVNYRDLSGETALHHCFPTEDIMMIKLLVENGANPLLADESGLAAIHLSMLNSQNMATARFLFDECMRRDLRNAKGASVLELDDGGGGNRLIHTAIMAGRRDIVEQLLLHNVNVAAVNSIGVNPALLAMGTATKDPSALVKMLLDHDPSTIDMMDLQGYTLLHYSARLNSTALLQLLLEYNPNLKMDCDPTPISIALLTKNVEWVKYLLQYATEKNIRGITQIGEDDLAALSLLCNDYELSKVILEYELNHSLEDINKDDLPRIKAILEFQPPFVPENTKLLQVIQMHGFREAENFLDRLQILYTSLVSIIS